MTRAGTGRRDLMGLGLALLNRLAGTKLLDRLGLREPVQSAVFQATRGGFRVAARAGRTFKAVRKLGEPARLPTAGGPELLDLTPTDEQRMIAETVGEFAT